MVPHDPIRRAGDRRWTARLVDALRAGDDLDDVATSLIACMDPRALAPLTELVTDRSAPRPIREVAGAVAREFDPAPGGVLRRWWAEGDDVLQAHALLQMGRAEADLVLPIASDPTHPLHREAIGALTFGFDEARAQAPKIAALAHPDPGVRLEGALALLYDEPAAAEVPLIGAARDADPEVAAAAIDALAYYPTRRVVGVLAECAASDDPLRDAAATCLRDLAGDVRSAAAVGGAARDAVVAWVAPVRELLGLAELPTAPPPLQSTPPRPEVNVDEVRALLADPDAPRRCVVDACHELTRAVTPALGDLGREMACHADAELRAVAASVLAAAGDTGSVLRLLDDPAASVRKAATWALTARPAEPEVAVRLWDQLVAPSTAGTAAAEAVAAWVAHASPDGRAAALTALVRDDPREGVRHAAVRALSRTGEVDAVRALLPLLAELPQVSWAVHLALLEAAAELGLPRSSADGLAAVDHLHVQAALGGWRP